MTNRPLLWSGRMVWDCHAALETRCSPQIMESFPDLNTHTNIIKTISFYPSTLLHPLWLYHERMRFHQWVNQGPFCKQVVRSCSCSEKSTHQVWFDTATCCLDSTHLRKRFWMELFQGSLGRSEDFCMNIPFNIFKEKLTNPIPVSLLIRLLFLCDRPALILIPSNCGIVTLLDNLCNLWWDLTFSILYSLCSLGS